VNTTVAARNFRGLATIPAGNTGDAFARKVALCRCVLAEGVPLALRLRGTSMLPALWPFETIVVRAIDPGGARVGDVVLLARGGELVVHRIVAAAGDETWITRGDAMPANDAPVAASALLGVVTSVHRRGHARPMADRLTSAERALAWLVQRSVCVRRTLDRLNGALLARARAVKNARAC
jgi:hypothetical protein